MKYIYGNWKMSQSLTEAKKFLQNWDIKPKAEVDVCLFPSFVSIEFCLKEAKNISRSLSFGGQDCSTEEKGAFTGEVSAAMLKEVGATHVLIGHSERRQRSGENKRSTSPLG